MSRRCGARVNCPLDMADNPNKVRIMDWKDYMNADERAYLLAVEQWRANYNIERRRIYDRCRQRAKRARHKEGKP